MSFNLNNFPHMTLNDRVQDKMSVYDISGYEFLNKNHFTIFKMEKATEFHCSWHYPNKIFRVFQLLEHLVNIARFLQINENLNLLLLVINTFIVGINYLH